MTTEQDWVATVILATLGGAVVLLVLWQLWMYFSRDSRERLNQSQDSEIYIKSNCRLCGGSIEFPVHGLGEWIDCPHCNRQLQLRRMGATQRFLVGVRVWCRERSFSWKWAFALIAVMLVCGTALFIYADFKAQSVERANQDAEREDTRNHYLEQQADEMERANQIAQEKAQEEAKRKKLEKNSQLFGSLLSPSLAQQQLNEMKRANDMAEMERIQPSDWYQKFRQQQALDDIASELRLKRLAPGQVNEAWVLKYNPFSNRYQYVPPTAQLKYNSLENRYEWVP